MPPSGHAVCIYPALVHVSDRSVVTAPTHYTITCFGFNKFYIESTMS